MRGAWMGRYGVEWWCGTTSIVKAQTPGCEAEVVPRGEQVRVGVGRHGHVRHGRRQPPPRARPRARPRPRPRPALRARRPGDG